MSRFKFQGRSLSPFAPPLSIELYRVHIFPFWNYILQTNPHHSGRGPPFISTSRPKLVLFRSSDFATIVHSHSRIQPDPPSSLASMTPPSKIPYRHAIGSLPYLMTWTRPDLSFEVSCLAQFHASHSAAHWTAVKPILRYLAGKSALRLTYNGALNAPITGFSDSDWVGRLSTRKSPSGYIFLLEGAAVSGSSKNQTIFVASSCEAEYVAAICTIQEALLASPQLGHSSQSLGSPSRALIHAQPRCHFTLRHSVREPSQKARRH